MATILSVFHFTKPPLHALSRNSVRGVTWGRTRITATARSQCLPTRRESLRQRYATFAVFAAGGIVLQNSFCTDSQKFCGLQARFSCKDVRGRIASPLTHRRLRQRD